ncbi:tRNA (adenosine(37)-N6)-threonylcarbamoyltransferase complex dimerization subunit type 1 TsaB [Leptolyngbya sp. 7M]|uniref:tRNA (adenosine(37)-N6)-threonylcarbamoyltransferase complex dimerization subunit type 1 TsaB n=1 Tax=Leptolyngbya sp. 7M TaxID=2812896 RepID=UPI001B8CF090|nr:tRNA (adenosine(37)-N6)-threonylcarbamoyltransferase complex dimerization subunit type 1 TsaB [Leptolyngbya sp. 7M]QYO67343.1 tRNA (adenosine(37)-N6)-threonylcarbamoyltransferase complex dimerization subunit type 1 TsaB [Leptolyngbya sp. 7M]
MDQQTHNPDQITLAIETAIRGGSLALLRGTDVVAKSTGSEDVSRAEKIIPSIRQLLASAQMELDEVEKIAVSRGPGSFTGIRIGIATALGLGKAKDVEIIGVSVLDAIIASRHNGESLCSAVPMGRNEVAFKFGSNNGEEAADVLGNVMNLDDFVTFVGQNRSISIAAHSDMALILNEKLLQTKVIDIGINMAEFIGLHCDNVGLRSPFSPIYLRNPKRSNSLF